MWRGEEAKMLEGLKMMEDSPIIRRMILPESGKKTCKVWEWKELRELMFFTSKLLTQYLPVGFVNKPCLCHVESHWTFHEIENLTHRPSWTYSTEITPILSFHEWWRLDDNSWGIVHELFGPEDQWMLWHPILQLSLSKRLLDCDDGWWLRCCWSPQDQQP